ncbi:MAG: hypothetical protein J5708_03030 [Bacteroidales bacterium]|nr:hypothetical protein [Bacteroidales bacterium]
MKKTLFLMIALAFIVTGCNKDKSKDLKYNDNDPIEIALKDYHRVDLSSDYDVTYTSSNPLVLMPNNGYIYGKNVGTAQLTMDNGYQNKTVEVKVSLFVQPTYEFGCPSSRIRELYGAPYESGYNANNDLVYRYTMNTEDGYYSYACGEMDFFFQDGAYVESNIYVRDGLDYMLERYLNENFDAIDTLWMHLSETDSILTEFYRDKVDETVILGKYFTGNDWNETLLFYYQVSEDSKGINPHKAFNPYR